MALPVSCDFKLRSDAHSSSQLFGLPDALQDALYKRVSRMFIDARFIRILTNLYFPLNQVPIGWKKSNVNETSRALES